MFNVVDFKFEDFENGYLDEIYKSLGDYMKLSLMDDVQRKFINGIIKNLNLKRFWKLAFPQA